MASVADKFRAKIRRLLGLPEDPGQPPVLMNVPLCWAKVVTQNSDGSLDVSPLDTRYSGEKNVPLATPFPNAVVKVSPGALVILAWAYGDPGQRFCLPIWGAGATLVSLAVGPNADPVATKTDIQNVIAFISAATYTPGPGTATTLTFPNPAPTQIGSTTISIQR